MSVNEIIWQLEPHTEAKHDILRRYLGGWFPIMFRYVKSYGGTRLVYIDGFAGPGEYRGGYDGSPILALKTLLTHSQWLRLLSHINYSFLFIEERPDRSENLKQVLTRQSVPTNIQYRVITGEFEPILTQLLDSLESSGKALAPAFVFIDPFGPEGFNMKLVQRILKYRQSEILITLNLRSLNQWYLPIKEQHNKVDTLYGTTDWRKCLTKSNSQDKEKCLRITYHEQLTKLTGLYVRDFRMENKHNQTAYFLVYVTHHPKGLELMKQAMWSVDPSGAFEYSDITNPNQPFLFTEQFDDMHAKEYADELLKRYFGQIKSKEQLIQTTKESEHYINRHLTIALDKLASENKVIPSSPKRGRGWPDGCTFRFL